MNSSYVNNVFYNPSPWFTHVGVVGYSTQAFSIEKANKALDDSFADLVKRGFNLSSIKVVSGLTDMGIPALAYRWAQQHGLETVGIACRKAKGMPWFPVNEAILFGKEWGDESDLFLKYCDAMIRIGGGKQSHSECKKFRETKDGILLEHDL